MDGVNYVSEILCGLNVFEPNVFQPKGMELLTGSFQTAASLILFSDKMHLLGLSRNWKKWIGIE
jgi:hypothetical protein